MSAYRKAAAALMLASLLAGCRTTARVDGGLAAAAQTQTIAMLKFDDNAADPRITDAASLGRTTNPPLGAAVSDAVGQALRGKTGCSVLLADEVARACRERHTSPSELLAMPVAEAARRLGVDYVVTGRVTRHSMHWFLFFSTARLSYEVECLQAGSGAVVWSGSADGCALFVMDEDLAADTAAKLAKALKASAKKAAQAPSKASAPAKPSAPSEKSEVSDRSDKPAAAPAPAPAPAATPLPTTAPAKTAPLPPTKPFKINPQPAN